MGAAGQGFKVLLSWDLTGHEGSSGVTRAQCDVPSMCPGARQAGHAQYGETP